MTTAISHPLLLKDLQGLHKKLVAAYVQTVRNDAALLGRVSLRHADSEIGGSLDAFVDLCAHRTGVQVLLRTVYLRVLEDLGLLDPPRIRGAAGLWSFQQAAPGLGVQAFFRYAFRDMAHVLPALFVLGPDELGLPSEELCQAIWDLWHHKDDGRLRHDFTPEEGRFDSRFLGDLYQDLDADIRKRFALLQTPEFVERYILDKTLTPALVEFDPKDLRDRGECFRVIDPTCGSGHFLTGAFHRLADWWAGQGCDAWTACERALESVWGCDINPHAVDIARLRLLLEVRARVGADADLVRLGSLTLNLRVLDSLVPWEPRPFYKGPLLMKEDLIGEYGSQDDRNGNAKFLGRDFHVVVGNPPYIVPTDAQKRDDYRTFWPNSCHMNYALSAPFVERLFSLGRLHAFTGQITSNSFMKRAFGKKLVEQVLPKWDLTCVVDSSGAYIPGHGTPTVILVGRCRPPTSSAIGAVLGRRGEPVRPSIPELGLVWTAIAGADTNQDSDGVFISTRVVARSVFSRHPWSLGGGSTSALMDRLRNNADCELSAVAARFGMRTATRQDDVFLGYPPDVRVFSGALGNADLLQIVEGAAIRDHAISPGPAAIFPYDERSGAPIQLSSSSATYRHFWRFRESLWRRASVGFKTIRQRGMEFYEIASNYPSTRHGLKIAYAFVATHNHFVLDRGGKVFGTAPVIKFSSDATAEDYIDILGLLNTSAICFWLKQVCQGKGNGGIGGGIGDEGWEPRYEFDPGKLAKCPITGRDRELRIALAGQMEAKASERAACRPGSVLDGEFAPDNLVSALMSGRERYQVLTQAMVALQEDLDWLAYGSFGLVEEPLALVCPVESGSLAPGHRPFEILAARADEEADEDEKSAWWSRHGHDRVTEIPAEYSRALRDRIQQRIDAIEVSPLLQLLESFAFKRRWHVPDLQSEARTVAEVWLLDRLDELFAPRMPRSRHTHAGALAEPKPRRLEDVAAVWGRDPRVQAVIDVWQGTSGYDLTTAAEKLLRSQALPDHDQRIYTEEGLRKREQWRAVWALQDREDKGETGLEIPVPPPYARTDFQKAAYYDLRGKLDVPRERFIAFDDLTPVRWGWNGWRDLQRGLVQAAAWDLAANDVANPLPPPTASDPRRCGPTLGLWQSLEDVRRWGDASHHAELHDLAETACGRTKCPCDVLPSWQAFRRTGRFSIETAVTQPGVTLDERAQALAVLRELAEPMREMLEVREGGGTLADVAARWPWSQDKLLAVLDDLCASGDVRPEGNGKHRRYLVRVLPMTTKN
jgi:SAM-dependent methyltransferase